MEAGWVEKSTRQSEMRVRWVAVGSGWIWTSTSVAADRKVPGS